jgi:prepilin-type N-terminal cleavage/methylation domain-containing protein
MQARHFLEDQDGFSLAEVLVTIVIVSIAFAAILGGMMTSIVVSDLHRKQATADALARSAAEAMKDQSVALVPCAQPADYTGALPTGPAGYSVSVTTVEYWDGTLVTNPIGYNGSCPVDGRGLQRVTISARSSDGAATETVQILKRQGS